MRLSVWTRGSPPWSSPGLTVLRRSNKASGHCCGRKYKGGKFRIDWRGLRVGKLERLWRGSWRDCNEAQGGRERVGGTLCGGGLGEPAGSVDSGRLQTKSCAPSQLLSGPPSPHCQRQRAQRLRCGCGALPPPNESEGVTCDLPCLRQCLVYSCFTRCTIMARFTLGLPGLHMYSTCTGTIPGRIG